MPDERKEKPVEISAQQWREMEAWRKGETKGDVVVVPPRKDDERKDT